MAFTIRRSCSDYYIRCMCKVRVRALSPCVSYYKSGLCAQTETSISEPLCLRSVFSSRRRCCVLRLVRRRSCLLFFFQQGADGVRGLKGSKGEKVRDGRKKQNKKLSIFLFVFVFSLSDVRDTLENGGYSPCTYHWQR